MAARRAQIAVDAFVAATLTNYHAGPGDRFVAGDLGS
jgi:hypothetical protein